MLERSMFKTERKTPEVSIAPLIDCVFLLLIFFMATTTFTKETGATIQKPKASKTDVMLTQNLLVAVKAGSQEELWCEGGRVDRVTLESIIRARLAEYPETNVVIVADAESITQNVVTAMDIAKRAGAKKISMAEKTVIEIPSR